MTVPAEGSAPAVNDNSTGEDTTNTGMPPVGQDNLPVEDSINPAWKPLLDRMPTQLHTQITPVLQEWDKGVNNKLQEVHSKYEPYKAFVEGNIPAEDLNQAYAVYQAMQQDPQKVVDAISEFYKLSTPEQGLQSNGQLQELPNGNEPEEGEIPFDLTKHPEYQQLKQMTDVMAQQMIEQKRAEQQATADKEFEKDLQTAKDKHGDFDEQYVANALIAAYHANKELSIDQAVQQYKAFEQSITQRVGQASRSAPVILGAGGGTPNQQILASQLGPKDRKKLVEDMLATAKAQRG